ncbi:uncharacterized protein cubi_03566 [Cryptosporidium ubiquitum]|uniref:Mini-chromosome maintenance complex-binding protein n=1 Tax=Cryptosporidium ubiquitum TaxID=857276 RepID=A0A1J4MHS9_9CRYT|nr:uncharacterized protein cubi_03566 [Cryptosporidium ubiquitum]OII73768.1 hypothetical protein cubi_03566 [Cryptosporidium ubiquitum]
MRSLLNTFIQHLNDGECDINELISNGTIEQSAKGYFVARGMIEYFQEQEVFISKNDFDNEKFPRHGITDAFDYSAQKYKNDKVYNSRSLYRFVPVPFENQLYWDNNLEGRTNHIDYFSDIYKKFDECIIKIYDFTVELPQYICSIEVESREIFSKYINSYANKSNINKQGNKNDIKINELVEVLTTVELENLNSSDYMSGMEEKLDGNNLKTFISNTQRRLVLHVISFKRISNYSPIFCPEIGYDGFLGESYSPLKTCEFLGRLVENKYPSLSGIPELYNISVQYISNEICNGNNLLSEYILMCICSRQKLKFEADTENTQNCITNPPQIVLHITMCNKEFVEKLKSFLLNHFPRLLWINANTSNLNYGRLTPYFDSENDCFVTGTLQIPLLRNLIVLDETSLEEGELSEKGLENISNISLLTNYGYVNYGFTNYKIPMKTESNYIILTSNKKSIFTSTSSISICMDSKDFEANTDCLNPQNKFGIETSHFSKFNFSSILKLYISIVGSCVEMLDFDKQTQDYIVEEFVNIRQRSNLSSLVHASTLHTWIMLARTQALMNGEEKLSKHRFEKFFRLELERLENLSNKRKNTILN